MQIGKWDSNSGDVWICAEAGINHNGSLPLALDLIHVAHQAGADAVKFQWFDTDALVKRRGPAANALRPYALGLDAMRTLAAEARWLGITWLCSVFDLKSLHAYMKLDPPVIKIGSGELTEAALLVHAAAYHHVPVILSTGMATMAQVNEAVRRFPWQENRLALLHCVSAYPTALDQVNLRAMDRLKAFHWPVGFSDHTLGSEAAVAAVARGAVIIEKHLTLDRSLPGPDHAASATPQMFADMVSQIRQITRMLGHGRKEPMECEAATMKAIGR